MFTFEYPPDVERQIRRECANTKEELPKPIREKQELYLGLALYLNAWHELDQERTRSTYQRIRRSDCFEYGRDYDLSEQQTEDLWFYISRMDRAFMDWFRKKQPPPKK